MSYIQQFYELNEREYIDDDEELISNPDSLIKFLNCREHYYADCFAIFSRIMNLGIKEMYSKIVLKN